MTREETLFALATKVEGIYVPMFYDQIPGYGGAVFPNREGVPEKVRRRVSTPDPFMQARVAHSPRLLNRHHPRRARGVLAFQCVHRSAVPEAGTPMEAPRVCAGGTGALREDGARQDVHRDPPGMHEGMSLLVRGARMVAIG